MTRNSEKMNLLKKHKEIILYIIFGALTTLVSWGSYAVFVNLFKTSVFAASLLSWICGVVFAFITNKIFVFESKARDFKTIIKEAVSFTASRGVTGIIEVFGVPLLEKTGYDSIFFNILTKWGFSLKILFTAGIYSKITLAFIVVLLNYIFSKLFVFKKKD